VRISLGVMAAWVISTPGFAQHLERNPPPHAETRPQPYLTHAVGYESILSNPPAPGSIEDNADQHIVEELQSVTADRRESATLDGEYVYPRFDAAFGRPVDRTTSPTLIRMLNRALRDVSAATFAAKDHFQRPRPYQRLQLRHLCGIAAPPKPEPHPTTGSSYPSGHSAYGWAAAMILARAAPERAEALMARAAEYGQSRLICGMHFPSDVAAGQTIAAAVIAHLDASPEFQADLARAREELAQKQTSR
jgi:acid phosphatase (class A)